MKKVILLMMVVLGMNAFAMRSNDGIDRDMRMMQMERMYEEREMTSRESDITFEERSEEEKVQWRFENMNRRRSGSRKNR